MLSSEAKMWVPVQRSAEDMFVDMGADPAAAAAAAAAVDQVAQAVQVHSPSTILHSILFLNNPIINHPLVSTNLVMV